MFEFSKLLNFIKIFQYNTAEEVYICIKQSNMKYSKKEIEKLWKYKKMINSNEFTNELKDKIFEKEYKNFRI